MEPSADTQLPEENKVKPLFDMTTVESLAYEITAGEEWQLNLPLPAKHELGFDVSYQRVEIGALKQIAEYDSEAQVIRISAGATENENAGDYQIILQLVDSEGTLSDELRIALRINEVETSLGSEDIGSKFA